MYQIQEQKQQIVISFTANELKHAPKKSFSIKSFGTKKKAHEAAQKYADSLIDLYNDTKDLSAARNILPELSNDKVKILIERPDNKTGVVGVYLEHHYDRLKRKHPYAYVSNYSKDGKQVLKRFPLNRFKSDEEAYRAAVAHRLFCINVNKNWLDA